MAASAYAALASLSQVLEQIQHPAWQRLHFDRGQIEALHEMVRFMLDFFEDHSTAVYDTDEECVFRAIANCIIEAENVIDSHVVDQLSQRSADKADKGYLSFCQDIGRVIQKFKTLTEKFTELREEKRSSQIQQPSVSLPAAAGSSAPPAPSEKDTVVGFDDQMAQIKDQLTGGESGLQIVPIVGMGGIGKTTLAQSIFHDPFLKKYFDTSIWITISQKYSVLDILVDLAVEDEEIESILQKIAKLEDQESIRQKIAKLDDQESIRQMIADLGEGLHKKLFGRRYLIVLDDVWSTKVWDDLKLYFPNGREGSRIIMTTRLSSISDSLGKENSYAVNLLDDEKSWGLLCKKVFEKEDCPDPELEKIGRRIASNCKGLPLAIVVIGGLLSKSNVTVEKWEEVAKKVNSTVNSEAENLCLDILSLSYNSLPIHLKPCFLYMRVYPEDYKVQVSQLIRSWIAEGFVISKGGKTLEEVAGQYLKDLIDRNLILTDNQFDYRGKMKRMIGIHDLLRDLCLEEYQKDNTTHNAKVLVSGLVKKTGNICHLCGVRDASEGYSLKARCPGLNTIRLAFFDGSSILLPSKIRYVDISGFGYDFDSTRLHQFWNLRSLSFFTPYSEVIDLPSEIWKMPQLRHVKFNQATLPEPPVDGKDSIILENLETLGFLVDFSCSEDILARIPNLKKLKIGGYSRKRDLSNQKLHNFARLHKLESLTIKSYTRAVMKIFFPLSLRRLSLYSCEFPWEEMTIIGSMPNLEVLKLEFNSHRGRDEWNPVDGEFLQLKKLSIHDKHLESWNAEKEHFPKLEFLHLREMSSLEKIPSGIGEIDTLLSISLARCPDVVVNSAKEIVEEQQSYGNEGLQLHLFKE